MRFFPIELIEQYSDRKPTGYKSDVINTGTALFDEDGRLRAIMLSDDQYYILKERYKDVSKNSNSLQEGPGTELKNLLSMIGIKTTPDCSCNARAAKMNEMGIDWCRTNLSTIVSWLQEEANRRLLPFSQFAARKVVQIAIMRAERKAAKSISAGT